MHSDDSSKPTPRLSIIVPCYNVAEYVEHCLDSILDQEFGPLEVIVLDDASTDDTWMLLQPYRDHPAVSLVHFDTNRGLGSARNEGMRLARGDYLLFVDSDDWISAGALKRLADCARQFSPDLIFFDYLRHYQGVGGILSPYRNLMESASVCPDQAARKLLLLDLPPMAWFKLYRREFVVESGIQFGEGFYEDISWTYPLTLLAQKVEFIPDALYCYRQRSGSILRSRDDRHLDLIAEYQRVLELVRAPRYIDYRQKMASKALDHYELILFFLNGRLSWPGLRNFLARVRKQLNGLDPRDVKNAVAGARTPASLWRRKVILSGDFLSFLSVFAWSKAAYWSARPLNLVRTYYSRRHVQV